MAAKFTVTIVMEAEHLYGYDSAEVRCVGPDLDGAIKEARERAEAIAEASRVQVAS